MSEIAIHHRPAELLQRLIRFDTSNPPGGERDCGTPGSTGVGADEESRANVGSAPPHERAPRPSAAYEGVILTRPLDAEASRGESRHAGRAERIR
jgi:hypothetical protein